MKKIVILIVLIICMQNTHSQTSWSVNDKYITANGKELFLNGVNYVPSVNWQTCLDNWNAYEIDKDFAALESIGVKCIRWFPLWPYIQPQPNKIDEKVLAHVVELFDLAHKHNIYVQLSFMSGWMSGFTFLPEWANGNVFTDSKIIEGEKVLINQLASKLKTHPALQGYDFGNEMNVLVSLMNLKVTAQEIDQWMQIIYKTIHEADPAHPVTNGIGTGFDQYFNTPAIAKSVDLLSNHSYPVFHRTILLDPKIGQRTLYSSNFITSWCKMEGKPVLIQETGSSEAEFQIEDIAKFLRITLLSNWANDASGYFWWCSSDIIPHFKVPGKGLYLKYSSGNQQNGELGRFEETLGLFDTNRAPKATASEYKKCVALIDKLGQGWQEQTPVVYLLIPEQNKFNSAILQLIAPYTLLKQNHANVKMVYETSTIPADAKALVIPGFALSVNGKTHVGNYLKNGGTVYQSYENDFAQELQINSNEEVVNSPIVWLDECAGSMMGINSYIKLPAMKLKKIITNSGCICLASRMTGHENPMYYEKGKPVFVNVKVGKGNYYYFAGSVENALENTYNPWQNDDSYQLYAAVCPKHEITLDNKFVEFSHKKRGNEEILILINHENSFQDVEMRSKADIQISEYEYDTNYGKNNLFYFRLKPAEVKVLVLKR